MKKVLYILMLVTLLFMLSCSGYKKLLKSTDIELKYTKAIEFYEKGDYFKSIQLFDELLTFFRGTERAEDIYYYYAYSHYGKGDYTIASYFFNNFVNTFPKSKYAEESLFMSAYCQYLESPKYSLDQSNTISAIRGMQNFINRFPQSTRIAQANEVIDKLRDKLQTKSFENANLYFLIEDYKSSITSLKTHLNDYPDSKFKEDAYFLIFKAHYLYAQKSITSRKKERFLNALDAYTDFMSIFPNSKYKQEADNYHKVVKREINKLHN